MRLQSQHGVFADWANVPEAVKAGWRDDARELLELVRQEQEKAFHGELGNIEAAIKWWWASARKE